MQELEHGYSAEQEAAIVEILREADNTGNGRYISLTINVVILKKFGRADYVAIEEILRAYGMSARLLAIPAEALKKMNPEIKVVVAKDMQTPMPYAMMVNPDGKDLETTIATFASLGLTYDDEMNMANLSQAGVAIVEPGSRSARELRYRSN